MLSREARQQRRGQEVRDEEAELRRLYEERTVHYGATTPPAHVLNEIRSDAWLNVRAQRRPISTFFLRNAMPIFFALSVPLTIAGFAYFAFWW